jgi:hypothetical protein
VLVPLLLLVTVALAQSGAYDLSWWTVDNGGATYMQGGRFRLGGTIAQPDAGDLAGGRFGLLGGWWDIPAALGPRVLFLPCIPKGAVVRPDLVVDRLEATGSSVTLVLRNIGNGPVRDEFWVDVYLNPNPPPTHVNQPWTDLSPEGLVWGVVPPLLPLMPGEALTLTVGDAYFWPSHSYVVWPIEQGTAVYAQADSYNMATTYGAVLEIHEVTGAPYNNILGPVYSGPGVAGERPAWGSDPASSGGLPARP